MIRKCQNGEIDMILTKSISRFSRNTQDIIKYVRMLRDRNIAIVFEKENINTLDMNGEMLLVVKRIRHRYFRTTGRKLSCVAVTLKLSMMSSVSSFRERRNRLCFRKRSSSPSSGRSSVKSMSVTA